MHHGANGEGDHQTCTRDNRPAPEYRTARNNKWAVTVGMVLPGYLPLATVHCMIEVPGQYSLHSLRLLPREPFLQDDGQSSLINRSLAAQTPITGLTCSSNHRHINSRHLGILVTFEVATPGTTSNSF